MLIDYAFERLVSTKLKLESNEVKSKYNMEMEVSVCGDFNIDAFINIDSIEENKSHFPIAAHFISI